MGSPSSGGGSTGGGGGGSPNQMSKDQAKAKITFKKEDDAREKARSTNYTTQPKKSTFKTSKKKYDDAAGKSKLNNYQLPKTGSLVLDSLRLARQKSFEKNREFFQKKVLTSKNRGGYEDTFDSYSSYMKSRLAGTTDAYGNLTPNTGGNDNTPAPTILKKTAGGQTVQTTAPTEAEVSQSAAADAEAYDLRKTKKRGRSMTTLTSSKGVTDDKLTLGKRSLLGS